jgi:hypothetical protein
MILTGFLIGALGAAAVFQQTDTLVQADGASRLSLVNFQGEVVVRTWDRDAVQVAAEHAESQRISIERSGRTIRVEPDSEHGGAFGRRVDFRLTVPRSFALDIDGVGLSVDVEGAEGPVQITTVHGPIRVKGGRESIELESVNGSIHVEGAQGDLRVTGVAGGVTVRDFTGDLYAQSVGGSLTLEGINSSDVEAGSVGGTLTYQGGIQDGGKYRFGSHGGQIWLRLPGDINAHVEALTLAGSIEVEFPGARSEPPRGEGIPGLREKRLIFEVGTGSARIEVETFGGTVHILSLIHI